MTSQIRSRIQYLKSSVIGEFSIRFNDNSEVDYFLLGHPVDLTLHVSNHCVSFNGNRCFFIFMNSKPL